MLAPEAIAALQVRPRKNPVFRAMDCKRPGPVHVLPVAQVIAPVEEADAGQLVFRPAHEVVAPQGRKVRVVAGGVGWVHVELLLPAHQRPALVLAAHPPAHGVAAEKRGVAPGGDVGFEVIAHGSRPVFIVPYAQHEPVVVQQFGMPFEVGIGAVVERVASAFRPLDKVAFPAVEQPGQRTVEGDAMPLQAAAAVVAVEAVAAPVVVGTVGIGG